MAEEEEQLTIDEYLDLMYGAQTPVCSEVNLRRSMDFTAFIFNLKLEDMLQLFEVSMGRRWCESKWAAWTCAGKSVWWLWTVLDKNSQTVLCNSYMRCTRRII